MKKETRGRPLEPYTIRYCEHCKNPIPTHRANGVKKRQWQYNRTIYCGHPCAALARALANTIARSKIVPKECGRDGCDKMVPLCYPTGVKKSKKIYDKCGFCTVSCSVLHRDKRKRRGRIEEVILSPMDLFLAGRTLTGEIIMNRTQKIRGVMAKIAHQFPKNKEGRLHLAIIAQAAKDLTHHLHGDSAAEYLSGYIPHAEICGVDSNWIHKQFGYIGEL